MHVYHTMATYVQLYTSLPRHRHYGYFCMSVSLKPVKKIILWTEWTGDIYNRGDSWKILVTFDVSWTRLGVRVSLHNWNMHGCVPTQTISIKCPTHDQNLPGSFCPLYLLCWFHVSMGRAWFEGLGKLKLMLPHSNYFNISWNIIKIMCVPVRKITFGMNQSDCSN